MQEQFIPGNSALPANTIQDLLASSDGALWVATSSGVCRIHNDQWRIYSAGGTPAVAMGLSDVQSLFETRDGRIILGSRMAGITIVPPKGGKPVTIHRNGNQNNWVAASA